MRKILLSTLLFSAPFIVHSQVFQEDWDGKGPGMSAWTIIDADKNPVANEIKGLITNAWTSFSPEMLSKLENRAAFSTSWYEPANTSNDWLISPQITIVENTATLVWNGLAADEKFRDGYKIMLSTNGGNAIADFDVELLSVKEENSTWTERYVNLGAYAGKTIRFAFVNDNTDKFLLGIDNILVTNSYEPTPKPACVTSTLAKDFVSSSNSITLKWNPSTSKDVVFGYQIYLGESPNKLGLHSTASATSLTISDLRFDKKYYWAVRPYNVSGEAVSCEVYDFVTSSNTFKPYCGPLVFEEDVEPITLVNFSGINYAASPQENSGSSHILYTGQNGTVDAGKTYPLTIQGNTSGNYEDHFAVFVDWNQNTVFEANETYLTPNIKNSTGLDNIKSVADIVVPSNAKAGMTKMRVKKIFGIKDLENPCLGAGFGQAVDFNLDVSSLSTKDLDFNNIVLYPNPVNDIVNIESSQKINSIKVFNTVGGLIEIYKVNAVKTQLNLSHLTSGVYFLTISTDKGISSTKIIKN